MSIHSNDDDSWEGVRKTPVKGKGRTGQGRASKPTAKPQTRVKTVHYCTWYSSPCISRSRSDTGSRDSHKMKGEDLQGKHELTGHYTGGKGQVRETNTLERRLGDGRERHNATLNTQEIENETYHTLCFIILVPDSSTGNKPSGPKG